MPFSLAKYGIYKLSEWEKIPVQKLNANCLIECWKDIKHYDELRTTIYGTFTERNKMKTFDIIINITNQKIKIHHFQLRRKRTIEYTPKEWGGNMMVLWI